MTCSPATACASSTASIKSIPVIGTYISFFLFGGEFPGTAIIGRLYVLHILLVPALILLMIVIHLFMVVVHKHTQYPGPGRNDGNVVGYPLGPVYAAKAGGFFFIVFGVLALMAAAFTINPIWNYGPYDPSPVSAGTQPDWYIGFVDGALRLMPGVINDFHFEWVIFGRTPDAERAASGPCTRLASSSRCCSCTRGSNAGSPRTTANTTFWTVRATPPPARRSVLQASPCTA